MSSVPLADASSDNGDYMFFKETSRTSIQDKAGMLVSACAANTDDHSYQLSDMYDPHQAYGLYVGEGVFDKLPNGVAVGQSILSKVNDVSDHKYRLIKPVTLDRSGSERKHSDRLMMRNNSEGYKAAPWTLYQWIDDEKTNGSAKKMCQMLSTSGPGSEKSALEASIEARVENFKRIVAEMKTDMAIRQGKLQAEPSVFSHLKDFDTMSAHHKLCLAFMANAVSHDVRDCLLQQSQASHCVDHPIELPLNEDGEAFLKNCKREITNSAPLRAAYHGHHASLLIKHFDPLLTSPENQACLPRFSGRWEHYKSTVQVRNQAHSMPIEDLVSSLKDVEDLSETPKALQATLTERYPNVDLGFPSNPADFAYVMDDMDDYVYTASAAFRAVPEAPESDQSQHTVMHFV